MKDLWNNGFQSVTETEMLSVDGGGCPCPWCGGDDKDESASSPVFQLPTPPQDPPGIELPGDGRLGPFETSDGKPAIGFTFPL